MSTISTIHNVELFDSKNSKALSDCRLSKIGYKKTKNNQNSPASKCVSVPIVNELSAEFLLSAQKHMIEWYNGVQDSIIRNMIDDGAKSINSSDIDESAVLEYLNAESESNRMTKEKINNWFDSELSDQLYVVFGKKVCGENCDTPSEGQIAVINKNISAYKEKFSALSSGATKYPENTITQLLKALEYSEESDAIAGKLINRLEEMVRKDKEVLEML